MKPTQKTVGLLTVRCDFCCDATVNAYSANSLHLALSRLGWAWLNEHAICLKCLNSDEPHIRAKIRKLQGNYRTEEE